MKYDWGSFGIDQGSSVDENQISQIQKNLGVTFPDLYLDLVIYADEASPEISSFSYGLEETSISEFFQFSSEITPYTISWYKGAGAPPKLPKDMVPIARDAGGNLICLNFKTPDISVEVFDPNSCMTYIAASSFDNFIKSWHE